MARNPDSLPWSPDLCAKCSVPEIVRANGSPDLRLSVTVAKVLGVKRRLVVEARCARHDCAIDDPRRGCKRCADDLRALFS